jgi:hypothetical protein
MCWRAGLSETFAHFRFTPGAHGGTITAIDEAASELIDPEFERPLRTVAPVAQLEFEELPTAAFQASPTAAPSLAEEPTQRQSSAARNRRKPVVPAWEDVLLGVRSSGER